MLKTNNAIKLLNSRIKDGKITRSELESLEVLVAIFNLQHVTLELKDGKLRIKQDVNQSNQELPILGEESQSGKFRL
jgi:hypothetical protein